MGLQQPAAVHLRRHLGDRTSDDVAGDLTMPSAFLQASERRSSSGMAEAVADLVQPNPGCGP